MHPSWRPFQAELLYYAFEPDRQEAARLRAQQQERGFEVVEFALAAVPGKRTLHITKHRGSCSFLEPDLNCEWFRRYRPGEGEVEATRRVSTSTIDEFARLRNVPIDFLKLDTEGSELEVLRGGAEQLTSHILGVRTSTYFQACYKRQPLYSEIHRYLTNREFFLLNLDYAGRGVPRNSLFRNPDPLSPDDMRYGTIVEADTVWLKRYDAVCERTNQGQDALAYATLKYAYFCFLNHAPDVAVDTLLQYVNDRHGFEPAVTASGLYRAVRRISTEFMGRWRVYPDAQWRMVRSLFKSIFGLTLETSHKYWELIQQV